MDFDKLKEEYGVNTPIIIEDFYKNGNNDAIRQAFSRAVKKDIIKRYANGIFYFPQKTILGKSTLSDKSVYEALYIKRNGTVFGYYTGLAFENMIGLSTQMPNTITIRTNAESSRKRTIVYNGKKVVLKRSRVDINNTNYQILQFLDMISDLKGEKMNGNSLSALIKSKRFKKKQLEQYIQFYPASVSRKLIKEGLIYDFT